MKHSHASIFISSALRSFVFLFALGNLSAFATTGDFVWAKQLGGVGDDVGRSITLDASGNIYTAGYFSDTADFDPGPGIINLTSAGDSDIFVSKMDASGSLVWVKQMGGPGLDRAPAVAVDAKGNVYTTGLFRDTADFDPGSGVFSLTSAGEVDIYVSKLDTNGNFVWAKRMGGTGYDFGHAAVLDKSGGIFLTGFYHDTAEFGSVNLTSQGGAETYIAKMDADGTMIWAKSFGEAKDDFGIANTLDSSGNIYTTGFFAGTVDFDPSANTFDLTAAGSADLFILKLDTNGSFLWAKQMGGTEFSIGYSIQLDSAGNIYMTGTISGITDFDPGPGVFNLTSAGIEDIFVCKLDANANFLWAKQMGGQDSDFGRSVMVDSQGNVVTVGYFWSPMDFDPSQEKTFMLSPNGAGDIYMFKLDSKGDFVWAKKIGGPSVDQVYTGVLDVSDNIYMIGNFESDADIDPGPATSNFTTVGYNDIVVIKLSGQSTEGAKKTEAP